MEENIWCIYKHTSPNGKIYIGTTKHQNNPNRRWSNGNGYKKNEYFWRAIQKYGWDNFNHEILEENLSYEDSGKREKYYIKIFNSTNKDFGYNIEDGGSNLKTISKETIEKANKTKKENGSCLWEEERKLKWSEKIKGKNNPNYGNHKLAGKNHPNYGKIMSKESKIKMSKSSIKHFVKQYDLNGNLIRKYDNPKDVEKYGFKYDSVWHCCKGCNKTYKSFIWKFDDETFDLKNILNNNKKVPVIVDEIIFETIGECAKYLNDRDVNLTRYLNGNRKMPQKYIDRNLRYYKDEE